MTLTPGEAAFVSAGGYHHLDFKVWCGEGVPPAPAGRIDLRHSTVVLDNPEDVAAVRERVQAAELLIIPDHYVYRMLYSQGVAREGLGVPLRVGTPDETNLRGSGSASPSISTCFA